MFQRVSTTTFIEITSLHPFYVYEWTVSAFTVGEGPYSSISTVTTPEDGKLILVLCALLIFHIVQQSRKVLKFKYCYVLPSMCGNVYALQVKVQIIIQLRVFLM